MKRIINSYFICIVCGKETDMGYENKEPQEAQPQDVEY